MPPSFGDVYLGTRGNDRVAVKVLRAELGEDLESLQARLRQEYKAQVRQHGMQGQQED